MKKLASWILRRMGWSIHLPATERPRVSIICVAPHTSNMDFFIGKLYYWAVGKSSAFLMKKEWFFFPLSLLLRAMGGIPVDRARKGSTSDLIREKLSKDEELHIAITPEGTRSHAERWRTGFYHMAREAGIPIEIAIIDYQQKVVGIYETFHPTGDIEADLTYIRSKYNKQQAKYPNLYNEG